MQKELSKSVLRRLPVYLEYLKAMPEDAPVNISATALAGALGMGEVQVRKDLASVAGSGRPKVGFDVAGLTESIERFLGRRRLEPVVVIGAGRLGTAILNYNGLAEYGFEAVAAFDRSRIRMGDPKIFSMEELPEFCKTRGVTMAVVAVPDYACQEVCDAAVAAGISKILNFSSAKPEVPSGILVEHLNIALSLAALKHTEG
jgi:redox-sensing transcriptional repressor